MYDFRDSDRFKVANVIAEEHGDNGYQICPCKVIRRWDGRYATVEIEKGERYTLDNHPYIRALKDGTGLAWLSNNADGVWAPARKEGEEMYVVLGPQWPEYEKGDRVSFLSACQEPERSLTWRRGQERAVQGEVYTVADVGSSSVLLADDEGNPVGWVGAQEVAPAD